VLTPGFYDLRSARARVPLEGVQGRRCLDVGSATGFWAFEDGHQRFGVSSQWVLARPA